MPQPYEDLEKEFGTWMDAPNAVAVSTGTAALHIALECLRLPLGSRVIVPDFTSISCARAVSMAGHTPVFVDIFEKDLLIDLGNVKGTILRDASVVMPVHIYGRQCDMNYIHALAKEFSFKVVEDLAEAHGVQPHPDTDAACWSFYKNKIVAGEEGGMITFKDPSLVPLARSLRCMGFTPEHDFYHIPRGVNARITNTQASLILGSLSNAEKNLSLRSKVAGWYDSFMPAEWRMPPRESVWVYDVRVPDNQRYVMLKALSAHGIQARCGFKPMSQQEEYSEYGAPNVTAHRLSGQVMYLPVTPHVTSGMAREACSIMKAAATTWPAQPTPDMV